MPRDMTFVFEFADAGDALGPRTSPGIFPLTVSIELEGESPWQGPVVVDEFAGTVEHDCKIRNAHVSLELLPEISRAYVARSLRAASEPFRRMRYSTRLIGNSGSTPVDFEPA